MREADEEKSKHHRKREVRKRRVRPQTQRDEKGLVFFVFCRTLPLLDLTLTEFYVKKEFDRWK